MNTELDYAIVDMMEKYGGSFVVALANAMRHADPMNFLKLKLAFPDYWQKYMAMIDPADAIKLGNQIKKEYGHGAWRH